jgi:hypothetical protein
MGNLKPIAFELVDDEHALLEVIATFATHHSTATVTISA